MAKLLFGQLPPKTLALSEERGRHHGRNKQLRDRKGQYLLSRVLLPGTGKRAPAWRLSTKAGEECSPQQ